MSPVAQLDMVLLYGYLYVLSTVYCMYTIDKMFIFARYQHKKTIFLSNISLFTHIYLIR